MDFKSKIIVSYLKVKTLFQYVIESLGLVQPESHPRGFYLEIVKNLKSGLRRKDVLVREMDLLRYKIASAGTVKPKELLDFKFDTLIAHTEGDFSILDYEIYSLEQCLEKNFYADIISVRPNYSKDIKSLENAFNYKIVLLKHLQKLTKIPLDNFSKAEKRQLRKEIRLAIK